MQSEVTARRLGPTGSLATGHGAEARLATDMEGAKDALNPVELRLSALAARMIKGVERALPRLKFQLYGMTVATAESAARLDLLHRNILKYGTISNTLAAAVPLIGAIRRT